MSILGLYGLPGGESHGALPRPESVSRPARPEGDPLSVGIMVRVRARVRIRVNDYSVRCGLGAEERGVL